MCEVCVAQRCAWHGEWPEDETAWHGMLFRLFFGTVGMFFFGDPLVGFAWSLAGWAYTLFAIFIDQGAMIVADASRATKLKVKRFIVSIGWSIDPLGYYFGKRVQTESFYMCEYWMKIHVSSVVFRYIEESLTVLLLMIEFYLNLAVVKPDANSDLLVDRPANPARLVDCPICGRLRLRVALWHCPDCRAGPMCEVCISRRCAWHSGEWPGDEAA